VPGIDAITTTSARAAEHYAAGLRLLLVGSAEATRQLGLAVAADPRLGVAFAALAVAQQSSGASAEANQALASAVAGARLGTRQERQHIEIVGLVLSGDFGRARALAAAHLAEFPGDGLIRHLITRPGGA
jgi:hypothetical protein